jgi:ABC-2 type transport system ATP-binding protein
VDPENGIEVVGLVRDYKKGPRAVDGIDLEVAPAEIYGFLGPNGAGKSTTVHVLTTLLPPTAGTAIVGGYDVVKAGGCARSTPDGTRPPAAAVDAPERPEGEARVPRRGTASPRRSGRRRR